MPKLTYERLRRALDGGERGGVFFIYGDEGFLKEEAVDAIVAAHLDPATRDFNLDQLRGTDLSTDTLASILQTPPMMAEWRVVVVREAQGLAGSPRARKSIDSLLDSPVPGLVVVLNADVPRRSRAKFYKRLKRAATAVECAPLDANDVPGWLMSRARVDDLELEADAAQAMAAAIGSDLGVLMREIAKLREYVGDRGRIDRADVEAVVGEIPRQNRWAWFDLVGSRRFAEAREALPILLEGRESGVGLVLGLGSHLLRIGLAVEGGNRALQATLPPRQRWLARKLTGQARGWSAAAVDAALDDLLRADRLLKSTSLEDRQVMDELLLRLQARRAEAA